MAGSGNAVPSDLVVDFRANSETIDDVVNSASNTTTTRETPTDPGGKTIYTLTGIQDLLVTAIESAGYVTKQDFNTGETLNNFNEALLWDTADGGDGEYYRWEGAFPKVVPAASTPLTTGGIGEGSWIAVGYASLNANINAGVSGVGKDYLSLADVIADLDLIDGAQGSVLGVGDFEIVNTNPSGYYVELTKGGLYIKPLGVWQIDSLKDIDGLPLDDGLEIEIAAFYSDRDTGGGLFRYDASESKANHDGGNIVDPSRVTAWDGTHADLATLFTVGAGTGCLIRLSDTRSIHNFGVISDDATVSKTINSLAFQQAIDSAQTSLLREVLFDFKVCDFEGDVYWRSYVSGRGSGRGSLLRFTSGALKVDGVENGQHVTNWEMHHFTLERTGTIGPALHLTGDGTLGSNKGAIRFKIDNVAVDGSTGEGYLMQNTFIGDIFSPLIRNCDDAGIKIRRDTISNTVGVNTVSIYGGEIQQCLRGYDIQHVSSLSFYGTAIEGNSSASLIGENTRNFSHFGGYYELNGSLATDRDVIIGDTGASPSSIVFDNVVFWDGAGAIKDHAIELVKCQEFSGRNLVFNAYEVSGLLNTGGGSAVTGRYSQIVVNTSGVKSTGDTVNFREIVDNLYLEGSAVVDLPSIASGAIHQFSIPVTGLSASDFVVDVSAAPNLQGLTLYGESRAGSVNVVVTNNTGAAVDIANATFRVICLPSSAFF